MSRRHELLLFHYSSALERGDFEAVAEVLRDAERDPLLEQMILDVNEVYAAEESHANPKEIQRIAALAQKRTTARIGWHGLSLAAALAVIAVLTALLAVQTRENTLSSSGNLPLAQAAPICQARVRSAAAMHSRPQENSVIFGTIPAGTAVVVLDQELVDDRTGDAWVLWFFVAGQNMQGWIPADAVSGADCPQAQVSPPTPPTPTPANLVETAVAVPMTAPTPNPSALALVTVVATGMPPNGIDSLQRMPTCTVQAPSAIDILTEPSADARVVEIVPPGTQIEIVAPVQEPDGIWYWVTTHTPLGGQAGGFILPNMVVLPSDCPYSVLEYAVTPSAINAATPTLRP